MRPGRARAVGVVSLTVSCSSPWSATGTRAASSARAVRLSWERSGPPATAKEA